MKKISLVAAAFCLSVSITACTAESRGYTKAALEPWQTSQAEENGAKPSGESGDTPEESASPESGAQGESQDGAQQETAGQEAGGTETQGRAEAGEQAEVTGIVEDASMNTLTIKAEDGTAYRFSTADAQVQAGAEGLLLGDKVTVVYETGDGQLLTAVTVTVSTVE